MGRLNWSQPLQMNFAGNWLNLDHLLNWFPLRQETELQFKSRLDNRLFALLLRRNFSFVYQEYEWIEEFNWCNFTASVISLTIRYNLYQTFKILLLTNVSDFVVVLIVFLWLLNKIIFVLKILFFRCLKEENPICHHRFVGGKSKKRS